MAQRLHMKHVHRTPLVVRPGRLAFTEIHDFVAMHYTVGMCAYCLCPYDDWRHLTPIKPEDRIFI